MKTSDIDISDMVSYQIGQKLGYPYHSETWMEKNWRFFQAVEQEKIIMYVIVALITAVAALNIISSLTMMVIHKRREIGVLKSMGARRLSIASIFLFEGLIIGVLGTVIGIAGGLALNANINDVADWISSVTHTERIFSSEIFYMDKIPVDIGAGEIVIIGGLAMILCVLATIYPALRAGLLSPVEVLRYE